MDGDKISIDKILDFYDPYISKSCIRPLYDEYGNVYIAVDMELKGRIREAIMKMILEFDIKNRISNICGTLHINTSLFPVPLTS